MRRCAWLLAVCVLGLSACGADESDPGVRGECAFAAGDTLCDGTPIETAEDACWKLVECGSIPVSNSEDDPDRFFDYAFCVDHFLDDLNTHYRELSVACVRATTCDQLRFPNSPNASRDESQFPPCLRYGAGQ